MPDTSKAIAALPMYDWPEVRSATDIYWKRIAEAVADSGILAPANLTRQDNYESLWNDPDLLFAQTCGLPYVLGLRDKVSLIGTPAYAIDSAPGKYFSVVIARKTDAGVTPEKLVTRKVACNSKHSQSGYAALKHCFRKNGFDDAGMMQTGSHRKSIQAVADGAAELAAIDAVTWELAKQYEPAVQQVSVVAKTQQMPGLPYITASRDVQVASKLTEAVEAAIGSLDAATKKSLLIVGFQRSEPADYDVVLENWKQINPLYE